MADPSPLLILLVAGLGLAFVLGTLANRLRISPIVGYLLAGVAVGPFTPGYVADQHLTLELADIGVILLMFGVGLHFSLRDLLAVRRVVLPGAILQVIASTAFGTFVALLFGWRFPSAVLFGAALSIASTVVMTRALQERRLIDSDRGRIAVGWLVVQDLITVIILVLLPTLAPALHDGGVANGRTIAAVALIASLGFTLAKLAAFFLVMWLVGRRVIPWILHYVAHTGSRELFRLAVLSVALGVAYAAAELFGVSIALGAFFAGMILSESQLSRRAAEESLPLRDAFAVLFFVSVGMLFDPSVFVTAPLRLVGTLVVIVLGTGVAGFAILRSRRVRGETAAFVAAGLTQIGEFSFVLINLGIGLAVLPVQSRDLILGASILSILLNPVVLTGAQALSRRLSSAPPAATPMTEALIPTKLTQHAIVVGYGRVGSLVVGGLKRDGVSILVVEDAQERVERLRTEGIESLNGNGADERVLRATNLGAARMLFVAIPQAFEAGQIVQQARRANSSIDIVARAHFDAEVEHLFNMGANAVIMGEREIAQAMLSHARAAAQD
ncbi:MAG TPA: YbaL family putative K(+) efflux transporter [Rhizomicrobium sp.]|nr:YbaL family putative K(+) efflux transporter [Rhizomicrobium sp.]